jgi:preprotein translocase subunit YajC
MGETVQSLVAQSGGASGLLGMLPFLVGMFVIMYFLMIRPERKRQAETQSMLSSLKRGDEIVLTSGVFAKIQSVEDRTLVVEIADKTRVKILKQAVMGPASRYLGQPADAKKLDDKKADDKKADEKKADDRVSTVTDDKKDDKKSA